MNTNDLITFYPNTVAKSSDVNHNFEVVANEFSNVNSSLAGAQTAIESLQRNKANIDGDVSTPFHVGDPTEDGHAVNKKTLDDYLGGVLDYISGLVITKEDSTHILVSAGMCFSKPDNVKLTLSSDQSVTNTGQVASSTYIVFITGNDDGTTIDIVINLSNGDPDQLPSNYQTHPQYRRLGYFLTDSSNNISTVVSESNTRPEPVSEFTPLNMSISATTTDLSGTIPADGYTYILWVYNSLGQTGTGTTTKISTDIFPDTVINKLDNDSGRYSQSVALVCVPLGQARTITVTRSCTIKGYMRA